MLNLVIKNEQNHIHKNWRIELINLNRQFSKNDMDRKRK